MNMPPDALILGYADELIAEYKAKLPPGEWHCESLEDRLAVTLGKIVRLIRDESAVTT